MTDLERQVQHRGAKDWPFLRRNAFLMGAGRKNLSKTKDRTSRKNVVVMFGGLCFPGAEGSGGKDGSAYC